MVKPVGLGTALGLGSAAVLHAWWAAGSTWPRRNADELADLVVGKRPFPSARDTWAVAGLLAGATGSIAARAGLFAVPTGLQPLVGLSTRVVSGALLARGGGGLVVNALGVGDVTDEFRYYDVRVFSPLCLALGAGAAVVARS